MRFYRKHKLRHYFVQASENIKDIIGIKFFDKKLGKGACITWGRIFNDQELLKVVQEQCVKQGFENIESMNICYSLQEIARYPYFYESWIYFVQQDIPYKYSYKKWKEEKQKALCMGKEIKFVKLETSTKDAMPL